MHKVTEAKIVELQSRIDATKLLDEDVAIAAEVFPAAYIWLDHEVNLSFTATSMDEIKQLLRSFAERKIMLKQFNESDDNPSWTLQGKNSTIRLSPVWKSEEDEGATCKLVKVGETTQTYPIYKLMCDGKEVTKEEKEVA